MIIEKTALQRDNCRTKEYYYESAREGLYDLLKNMVEKGLTKTLFLPGYIGWSPKEGSGIFDPVKQLNGLSVQYYRMTADLSIDSKDLEHKIKSREPGSFSVLIINYFGFTDPRIKEIFFMIRKYSGWILEDNAHGFFTYYQQKEHYCDAALFSLHKLFPFEHGGSLVVRNDRLKELELSGGSFFETKFNPWQYDIIEISRIRRENYRRIEALIAERDVTPYIKSLKSELGDNVPQTFPVCVQSGNRDRIYELMNEAGYGVVSLYHTLIEPLRQPEFEASLRLSHCILNLPVHQDADSSRYPEMIKQLLEGCRKTEAGSRQT